MDEKKGESRGKNEAQKETDLSRPFVATAVASDVGRIGKAVVVNFHSQQSPPARGSVRGSPVLVANQLFVVAGPLFSLEIPAQPSKGKRPGPHAPPVQCIQITDATGAQERKQIWISLAAYLADPFVLRLAGWLAGWLVPTGVGKSPAAVAGGWSRDGNLELSLSGSF